MPVYEYECKSCGERTDVVLSIAAYSTSPYRDRDSAERRCGKCDSTVPTIRLLSFTPRPDIPAHYNQSAGQFVTGQGSLDESFKRQSEAASVRTGMEHSFVAVDPRDKERLGITDEGLAETFDRRTKLGMRVPTVVRPENMS